MKLNNLASCEEVLRIAGGLRWASVVVIAALATGWQQARAGINEWTPLLGPYGGHITALAIDPQDPCTMHAGTGSGVFKTIDGAASWMPASAGLGTNPFVFGLAIDPQYTISVTIADWPDIQTMSGEPLEYVGAVPGEVAGVMQIKVRIPAGITPGSAVPVSISVGSRVGQYGISIAVSGN